MFLLFIRTKYELKLLKRNLIKTKFLNWYTILVNSFNIRFKIYRNTIFFIDINFYTWNTSILFKIKQIVTS